MEANHVPAAASGPSRNRLAWEASPYLRQHQSNPVDWYPWGTEAFERARREAKPIFLSIGYSTCHWCHVMERESFENPGIAALLNRHFVSIKVDREERPDVDKIYMTAVQAMTGQGGWPLSVFLTPDLKPFYGGTYFPPDSRYGRPGFGELLEKIARVWESRRGEVLGAAEELHTQLASWLAQRAPARSMFHESLLADAAEVFKSSFDPVHGGFGGAPKFPQPSVPRFLLEYGVECADRRAVEMVLHTCRKMAAGGIHDHLGGGFARYSVDAEWTVPHFEKMLYDQAQLLELYLDAWLVSGDWSLAGVARGIAAYVLRDMTHPAGGFFSAEDADSEGREGKFYCWTLAECRQLLTLEELEAVVRHFGLSEEGNFVDHSDPDPLPGQNVLRLTEAPLSAEEQARLESAKAKMNAARARRVRPQRDDKVLASWNGLMLAALARYGLLFQDETALAAARRNALFAQTELWDAARRRLHHRWWEGRRDEVQLLEAYAFQLHGQLAFYETTLEPAVLAFARLLAEAMLERFHDAEDGGFWQSEAAPDLIVKVKDHYDGAEPSGNSVAALALFKLALITGERRYHDAAAGVLRAFAPWLNRAPQSCPNLLRALAFFLRPGRRLALSGGADNWQTRELLGAAHRVLVPGLTVCEGDPHAAPAAHLCVGETCQAPLREPAALSAALAALLAGKRGAAPA